MASRRPSVTRPSAFASTSESDLTPHDPLARSGFDSGMGMGGMEVVDGSAGVVQEGGYGWVVTACGFSMMFCIMGILYAWGVIQAELVRQQIASTVAISAIGALSAWSVAIGCLPASWILSRLGPRKTTFCGITLVAVSLIVSGSLTNSLGGLMFTIGVMFGFGNSMMYLPAYTIPSQWFSRLRGLATGLVSCGAGLGGAVFSIAIARMIETWGMPWTFRFLGLLVAAIGLPASWLLRPGKLGAIPTDTTRHRPLSRSSRFIRVLLACFIASYPFFIPPYFIPLYTQSVGLSASEGALNAAMFNVSSAAGRILFGIAADKALGNINAWSMSMLIIALSSLLVWPFAVVKGTILLFVIICGLGSGGFFTLQSSVCAQIVGDHRVDRAIGWVEVAQSFGYLAGPLSAGALLDAFGGTERGAGPYKPAIYLVGASTALAWFLIVSVRISSSKLVLKRI